MRFLNKLKNFCISPNKEFEEYKKGNFLIWGNIVIILIFSVVMGLIKANGKIDLSSLSSIDPEVASKVAEYISRPEIIIPPLFIGHLIATIIGTTLYYFIARYITKDKEIKYGKVYAVYSFIYGINILSEIVSEGTGITLLSIPFQILFYCILTLGMSKVFDVKPKKFAVFAIVMFILTNAMLF